MFPLRRPPSGISYRSPRLDELLTGGSNCAIRTFIAARDSVLCIVALQFSVCRLHCSWVCTVPAYCILYPYNIAIYRFAFVQHRIYLYALCVPVFWLIFFKCSARDSTWQLDPSLINNNCDMLICGIACHSCKDLFPRFLACVTVILIFAGVSSGRVELPLTWMSDFSHFVMYLITP